MHNFKFVDENGKPVDRNPIDYPYSYDNHAIYRNGRNDEITNTEYSDRLMTSNSKKHKSLCNEIFGSPYANWSESPANLIEKFIKKFFNYDHDVKLILLMKGCNNMSGYPYHILRYKLIT